MGISSTIQSEQKNQAKPGRRPRGGGGVGGVPAAPRAFWVCLHKQRKEAPVEPLGACVGRPWAATPCLPLSSGVYIAESDLPLETETLAAEDGTRKEFIPEMLAWHCALYFFIVGPLCRGLPESYI